MQMRLDCATIAQCRGAALPAVRPSQAITSCAVVTTVCAPAAAAAAAVGQAVRPAAACSNSPLKVRGGDTASDSASAVATVICSRSCAGAISGGALALAGGGVGEGGRLGRRGTGGRRRRRDGIESRAAVQESSLSSTVVEHAAATEYGSAAILTDRRSADLDCSDYIGFGCLLEDGSFFRERFVIRFSEAGHRGTISLETLSSLLQEAATNHVIAMDYAFAPGKNLEGNITVITRMHIEVDRYPAWRNLVEVDTWFQREGKNAVRRDWIVKDVKTGEDIVFATSTWVLMNTHTRRLTKLTDDQWLELEPHMRYPPKWALSEERREVSTTKITKLGDDATFKRSGLTASDKDTDMNQHVNNIRYMSWMLESIPEEVKNAYEISKITLEYRQEATRGDIVESVAETEASESSTNSTARQFIHLIKTSEVGKEVNRGRTVWRPV